MGRNFRRLERAISNEVFHFDCYREEPLGCMWAYDPDAVEDEMSLIDAETGEYVYHYRQTEDRPQPEEVVDELGLGEKCDDIRTYHSVARTAHVKCAFGDFNGDGEDLVEITTEVTELVTD